MLGLYSFTLPHTPPSAAGKQVSFRSIAGLDAMEQLGSKSFWVFIISALLICIPLAAYYNYTQLFLEAAKVKNIAATQTLGQMSEMLFMLAMPLMFRRLGVKWMLVLGMSAWVVRYGAVRERGAERDLLDDRAGHPAARHLLRLLLRHGADLRRQEVHAGDPWPGAGLLRARHVRRRHAHRRTIAGNVFNRFLAAAANLTLAQWNRFWWLPAAFAAAVTLFFTLAFHDRVDEAEEAVASKAA